MVREVKWIVFAFVIPVMIFHLGYVFTTESPIALIDRILFREDACPYLFYFVIALAIFGFISIGRIARSSFEERRNTLDGA